MSAGTAYQSPSGELVQSPGKEINYAPSCPPCSGMRVYATVPVAGRAPFPSWVRTGLGNITYGTAVPGGTADEKEAIEYALGADCLGKDPTVNHPGDNRDQSRYLTLKITRSGTCYESPNIGIIDNGEEWRWDKHTGQLIYCHKYSADVLVSDGSTTSDYVYHYEVDLTTGSLSESTTGTLFTNPYPNLDAVDTTNQEALNDWHDGSAVATFSASESWALYHVIKDVSRRDPPDEPDRSYDQHYDVWVSVVMSDGWSQEWAAIYSRQLLKSINLLDTSVLHNWVGEVADTIDWDTDMVVQYDMTVSDDPGLMVGLHVAKSRDATWPAASGPLNYATANIITVVGSTWAAECAKSRNCGAAVKVDGMCLVDFEQAQSVPFAQYGKLGVSDTGTDPTMTGEFNCSVNYDQNAYWSRFYDWGYGMLLRPDCGNAAADSTYDECCGWAAP